MHFKLITGLADANTIKSPAIITGIKFEKGVWYNLLFYVVLFGF